MIVNRFYDYFWTETGAFGMSRCGCIIGTLWGWGVMVFDCCGFDFEIATLTVSSCGDVTDALWDFLCCG